MIRSFVPPYVLERIAASEEPRLIVAPSIASATLRRDAMLRDIREAAPRARVAVPGLTRTISDAQHRQDLPGVPVRREGDPATGDVAVDEAYDGFGATYALFEQVYGRDSIDGHGGPLDGTVHFGVEYDNAFWDGRRMVFGDGDGEVFRGFTGSLTVIGHELTHGVVQHTANLAYQGQAGALNESIADVFGVLVEQYHRRQTAAEASWLVGGGLFMPDVQGVAMRSMKAPGTAYDDDVLGSDPQPAHMRNFVRTSADNGGVHINSGIPNRAFAATAIALGGHAWERAGWIWFDVLTGGRLAPRADFVAFAAATRRAARARFGAGSREEQAVAGGWEEVGIEVSWASEATGEVSWASEATGEVSWASEATGEDPPVVRA